MGNSLAQCINSEEKNGWGGNSSISKKDFDFLYPCARAICKKQASRDFFQEKCSQRERSLDYELRGRRKREVNLALEEKRMLCGEEWNMSRTIALDGEELTMSQTIALDGEELNTIENAIGVFTYLS